MIALAVCRDLMVPSTTKRRPLIGRQLPDAIDGLEYRVDGNEIASEDRSKLIRIHLTDLGIEDKGSLHLSMQRADFTFGNMSEPDIAAFMAKWEKNTLRLGG